MSIGYPAVYVDPNLFRKIYPLPSFKRWYGFGMAVYGHGDLMDEEQRAIFRKCTKLEILPTKPFSEVYVVAGRSAGKTISAVGHLIYKSAFMDYSRILSPGERIICMMISADRRQAKIGLRYAAGFYDSIPLLTQLVESRTAETINLRNRVSNEIHTANFRSIRGYSIGCCVCDEIAFWRDETSANPDKEIINALRPGLARVPGSLLLCISSPYARRGLLWEMYHKHFGVPNDRILIWQADSFTMNLELDPKIGEAAYELDPAVAAAEYGGQFRIDVESFVSTEVVEAVTVPGRFELPFLSCNSYVGFVDPSGGSVDSMTLGIAHQEGERVILDCLRESKPPFSPDEVVKEFCETLGSYQSNVVIGDRYGGEWPRERFRARGIEYEICEKSKSELYAAFLPLLNSKRVELLDNSRMLNQLLNLERRTGRSHDSIDHGPGGRDDLCNAAAGACFEASKEQSTPGFFFVRSGPLWRLGDG